MWVYNLVVFLYVGMIHVASLFNSKAKLWVAGRKNIFPYIESELQKKIPGGSEIIWFHCASLGEFEQGRPVIEKIKEQNKKVKIVLTFFSPSGYEIRKNYELADAIFYLPIDLPSNTKKFISILKPGAAVFVKYEFWLNYLAELKKQNIPVYLISAVFRKNQHFFKGYGKIFLRSLHTYKKIFLQDENSFSLLKESGLYNIEVAGDTRFDRVMQITQQRNPLPQIDTFCLNSTVLIAGSTWPKDEELVLAAFKKLKQQNSRLKLLLVPHEVDEASINHIEKLILKTDPSFFFARYTSRQNFERHDILVVDTIGLLSQLYRYAAVAYVGGGFNDGIHSILEAMAYGVPVSFGPNNHKFVEAQESIRSGIGKAVHNEAELESFFSAVISGNAKDMPGKIKEYMRRKTGATERICRELM
ncbi:MAG TPA: glycosyltransferase N-terminal domain-containing protein [Bacteroidia bacterium]|nr:glycosyltransferase N-terminal domain-containing protein [Bacteroidia bacterium]